MRVLHRIMIRAAIVRVDSQGRTVDIHSLRATCATQFARHGVSMAVAQRVLGHSSPTLTAQHYTLLDLGDLRAGVEAVGGISSLGVGTRNVG